MSWSSDASSAPGFGLAAGRRRATESRSPVAYRESPMAYEPTRYCSCNPPRKAPRWISWSRANPGRRYFSCPDAKHGGCGYVDWFDDPLPKFFSDLIGDLRDEVWRLRGEGNVPRHEAVTRHEAVRPIEDDDGKDALVLALQAEVKRKNAEIDAVQWKFMNLVYVCIVFVLGLVVGKVLLN